MDDQQQLVDRLVVVTEEQDVLWVLVMIGEMKESGCLEQAIDASHSWKRYSALEGISRLSDLSTLHRFIAQLLVLSGATTIDQGSNEKLLRTMESWEEKGREEAREAQNLLSLDIADAADWIDSTLPLPPNPDSLTGGGPLPPRPTYLSPTISSIPNTPETSPLLAHVESFDQPSLPASEPCPRLLTLLVSGLPGDFATEELGALFSRIRVETHHLWFGNRGSAFAQVAAENVQLCIDSLDRSTILGDLRISCGLAKNQLEDSTLPRSRSSSPSRRHRPSAPSLVSISNEPSSVTSNKPTLTHSSGRSVSTCLDSRDDRPRIRRPTLSPSNRSLSPRRRSRSRSPGRWEDEDVRRRPSQLSTRDRDSHSPRRPSGWTTLHFANLPPHFNAVSIARVFKNIGVVTRGIHQLQNAKKHFAFLDVKSPQVAYCVNSFNNKQLEGYWVGCGVSRSQLPQSSSSFGSRESPYSPPPSPSTRSTSELHLAHLPLHYTDLQVRELFHDFGVSPVAIRQRNNREGTESFAFVEVDSEDVRRCIYRLDFESISKGVRLSCQLAKEPRQHRHRPSSSSSAPPIDHRLRDRQSSTNSRDEAGSSSKNLTNLHVAGLPPQIHEVEVVQLFARFGIKLFGLRLAGLNSSRRSPYAFVEVETDQAKRCMNEIDGLRYKGYKISCYESKSSTVDPLPTPPPLL